MTINDTIESAAAKLSVEVVLDNALAEACKPFDYAFSGRSEFVLPPFNGPQRDGSWSIGLIVGPSGSGKTHTLKKYYGISPEPDWNSSLSIVSQLGDFAAKRLAATGLNSVPTWCRPYHVLSNGEQFRARMAAMIETNASFDEFTSVVDRTVAKACSHAIQRYIRENTITGVVFASCHYDIIEWLQPDWTYDTITHELLPRGSLQRRPEIAIQLLPCGHEWWPLFKAHHYMSANLSKSAKCWIGTWNDNPTVFVSSMRLPSGTTKNAWREHRTVVLPDFQGLGIGVRASDAVAAMHKNDGQRYYSKTAHPRMGGYRDSSPAWKPTKHNHKTGKYLHGTFDAWKARTGMMLYSHEYVGLNHQ